MNIFQNCDVKGNIYLNRNFNNLEKQTLEIEFQYLLNAGV